MLYMYSTNGNKKIQEEKGCVSRSDPLPMVDAVEGKQLSVNVVEVKDSVLKCGIIITVLHLKIKNVIIRRSRANNICKLVTYLNLMFVG